MITFTPNFTFHTGRILPAIAFGTGTSYFERNNDVTEGIVKAFGAGFRYIDTAIAYQTEEGVGKSIRCQSPFEIDFNTRGTWCQFGQ